MVVIGDACGRGCEGAALLPGILPRARQLASSNVSPGRLLRELNRTAVEVLPLDRFVTAAAVEIERDLCTLTMANAGHVRVLTRSELGNVRLIGRLAGPPLGVLVDAVFAEECIPFREGDSAVLMTDGVLEAMETDLLEMRVLRGLVARSPAHAEGINRAIWEALEARLDGRRADDVTLVTVELPHAALGHAAPLEQAS